MKQKAKNGRKNSFLKIQKKKKKAGNEIADFQNATNANEKGSKKEKKKIVFENKKIRKRGCRFSKCNQHLRPLLLLHAIKELQSQQKHRNATLFFHKHQHART